MLTSPFKSKDNFPQQLPVRNWTAPFLPGAAYLANKYGEAMTYLIKKMGFKKNWLGGLCLPAQRSH